MTPKTETIFSDIIQAALDITLNFIDSSFALLTSTASVQQYTIRGVNFRSVHS